MKKILVLLIIVFMLFSVAGCNMKNQSYSVLLVTDINELIISENNGFKYNSSEDVYSSSVEEKIVKKDIAPKNFTFMDSEYTIEYTKSYARQYNEETIDVFTVPETGTEFAFYEETGLLADVYAPDTVIKVVDGLPTEEKDYIEICEKIAPDVCNSEEYVLSCETYSIIRTEKAIWPEKKDGFVPLEQLPENATTYYCFTYTKYIEGIPSDDSVYIELKIDGSINMVLINTLDTYENFDFSLMEARNVVDATIKELCDNPDFSLEDYETTESFVSLKGKVALMVIIEPNIKDLSTQKTFSPSPVTLFVVEE